ncbi:Ribosome-recycling factor [Dirofilaria immitis]
MIDLFLEVANLIINCREDFSRAINERTFAIRCCKFAVAKSPSSIAIINQQKHPSILSIPSPLSQLTTINIAISNLFIIPPYSNDNVDEDSFMISATNVCKKMLKLKSNRHDEE